MKPQLNKILKKGKALFLAYDQGLEHGPVDFNDKNVDPKYIIDIAKRGGYQGVVFHKGIAEKYNYEIKKSKVPLIVKLNGKTRLVKGEPISEQVCSVDEAIELGASAVGYTIYIGSEFESEIFNEFSEIQEEAHSKGLAVIAWIYPRGKSVEKTPKGELMVYACRVGSNRRDREWALSFCGSSIAARTA
jgi:class I fructose-bisphosphate aldolase